MDNSDAIMAGVWIEKKNVTMYMTAQMVQTKLTVQSVQLINSYAVMALVLLTIKDVTAKQIAGIDLTKTGVVMSVSVTSF
jgi:glucokinase